MLGGNKSVVDISMTPHNKTHKRHAALSFHLFRELIVVGVISYYFTQSSLNLDGMLSKNWSRDNA